MELDQHICPHMILQETPSSSGYFTASGQRPGSASNQEAAAAVLCFHVAGSLFAEGLKVCEGSLTAGALTGLPQTRLGVDCWPHQVCCASATTATPQFVNSTRGTETGSACGTDIKPFLCCCPFFTITQPQLLLVQRADCQAGRTPLVFGYFICAAPARLQQVVANGPSELLSRQARNITRQRHWERTHQQLNPQGVAVWEANVSSLVDLHSLQPRFEYMQAEHQQQQQHRSSSGSYFSQNCRTAAAADSSCSSSSGFESDCEQCEAEHSSSTAQHGMASPAPPRQLQLHAVAFRVEIKPAGSSKGLGLFAAELIPKGGAFIGPYGGRTYLADDSDKEVRTARVVWLYCSCSWNLNFMA